MLRAARPGGVAPTPRRRLGCRQFAQTADSRAHRNDFVASWIFPFERLSSALGDFAGISAGIAAAGGNLDRRHLRAADTAHYSRLWRGRESHATDSQDSGWLQFALFVLRDSLWSREGAQPAAGHRNWRAPETQPGGLSRNRLERDQSRHLRPRAFAAR